MLSLLLTAALAPQGPGPSLAPVVINEFAYDDAGTDDKEFVELWNRTGSPIDISGWVLQCIEGSTTAAVNSTYTIPAATIINPGQYLVIGTATVPNVNLTRPVDWLENSTGPDGIVLFDPTMTAVDSVLWCFTLWTAAVPAYVEGSGIGGRVFTNDTVANPNFQSCQRRIDGYDSNDNGLDFVYMGWTPGAANGSTNVLALNLVQLCDAPTATSLSPVFSSSFAAPVVADPVAITRAVVATVPQIWSIPPSPQGGNVAVMNDVTGGGSASALRLPVGDDYLVECYVYVSGGNPAIGGTEGEAFGIGVGTTDSYGAPPNVPGTYYAATSACAGVGNREPGATGIAWFGFQTTGQTEFYLVDLNNGGAGWTVLGGPVVATPGVNDGWQRLRIRVSGTSVVGNFGGTFAVDDGTRFTATVASRPSGLVYFQYRECVLANANLRPLTIDRLEVYGIVPFGVSSAGTASPTTLGTPNLATSGGDPVIGNSAFTFQVSGHVPSGIGALLLGLGALGPGSPVPGAPATVQIYVAPIATVLLFSDGLGNTSYTLPLPNDNSMAGLPLTGQTVDLDANLAFPVPIGCSQGLQVTIGN